MYNVYDQINIQEREVSHIMPHKELFFKLEFSSVRVKRTVGTLPRINLYRLLVMSYFPQITSQATWYHSPRHKTITAVLKAS